MRKFTLLILLAAFSVYAIGQTKSSIVKTQKHFDKKETKGRTISNLATSKAVGDVIWSNDFSVPAEWSIYNNTADAQNWVITNIDDPNVGYGRGTWDDVDNLVTNENNYGMFDSDAVGSSGGVQDAYLEYTGTIDCSASANVSCRFAQRVAMWSSTQTILQVSNDGSTWVDFQINEGRPLSTLYEEFTEVNISSVAGGQAAVHIRFNYQGEWDYLWLVDDVSLKVAAENELVLENAWADCYGLGYYSQTPVNQVTPVTQFYGAIFNNGALMQTGVQLNVEIDDNSQVVHSITGTIYDMSMPGARDTIDADTSTTTDVSFFYTPNALASYNVNFTLTQLEADEDLGNNDFQLSFDVVDTTFSRAITYNTYTGPSRYTGGADGDRVGCSYYFPNADEVNSMSLYIPSFSDLGTSFRGVVLGDDGAGNLIEIISTDIVVLQDSTQLGTWHNIPFIKDGASEFLAGDAIYYAMVECYFDGIGDLYIGADNTPYLSYEDGSMLQLGGSNYFISVMPMVNLNVVSTSSCTAYISDKVNASCNGTADGAAMVSTAGCASPYTYLWSDGQTTEIAIGLAAGQYFVTVTDNNASTSVDTVTITEPAVLALTEVITGNDINVTITGGTPSYTYLWSHGATTQDVEGLADGTYHVTCTDANGCEVVGGPYIVVGVNDLTSTEVSIYPNPTQGILNIANVEGARVTVYNIIGEVMMNVESTSNNVTLDMNKLSNGSYIVKVVNNSEVITRKVTLRK